ncbi:MAG TPA: 4-hydroxy-tetrahydrodipicolinate reductase [Candidatus Nanoarchaeia archaeon]|nr:4-hydroxy-tetrahydrodipicolinate reductase [Candidatus Nanoarchaeia archaeon]
MKIALIGYGKLGREIEVCAKQRGHTLVRIDPNAKDADYLEVSSESLKGADIAIEGSHPSAVMDNIAKTAALGVNLVVCTTGWYERMEEVSQLIAKNGTGLIWSGNFSLGVNFFMRIVEGAAALIDQVDGYDISIHEFHHAKKADSPSGTALMLGNAILKQMTRKESIVTERLDRPINPNELHISSTRCGSIPGIHKVTIDSAADTIELTHTARTRQGFALGAVLGAEFIAGKKGVYTIDDLMNEVVGG